MVRIFAVGVQLATLVVFVSALYAILTRLKSTKREYYVLFLFAGIIYVLGEIFSLSAISADGAFFSLMLMFLGGILSGPLFLIFLMNYLGYNMPKRVTFCLFAVAFALIGFIWATPWHDLFYVYIYLYPYGEAPTISNYGVVRGVLYPLVTAYITIYMLVPIAVLLRQAFRPNAVPPTKLLILLFCAAIPGLTHLLYFFELAIHGLYLSMFLAPAGGIFVYFGVLKYDLLENEKESEALERERAANELNRVYLDACPMFIEMWDGAGNLIYANEKVKDIFGLRRAEDFISRYRELSPEFQPCGTPSMEKAVAYSNLAYKEGHIRFEWMHIHPENGELLPVDTTLVRLKFGGKNVVVGYNHDLRPIKAAMESEENSRAKTRFLARMSHEIRTPITAVLGISEVQLRRKNLLPEMEEAFAKIYDSAKTLLYIVNDILDFSRIESGKMSLINSEYDVAGLVNAAAQLHMVYSERKEVTFRVSVDENIPAKLIGDVLRIRQIITNLLTNAFKFTEAGTVDLQMHCEEKTESHAILVISIHDTGIGMSEAQLAELKGDFVRLHEQEKPFVGGTGLGVSIVYSLVAMMDAEFNLQSEVGKGTSAIVRIPQVARTPETIGREQAERLRNFESAAWRSSADELEFVPRPMPHGKVLVVDDIDTNLYVTQAMLEAFQLTVELCESGAEAVQKIKDGNVYDIIFMDHMMPGMNGVEATKIIRGMDYTRPIIALTANAIHGQSAMFMQNGFSGFMSKPVDIKILNSYLVRFVKK